MLPKCSVTKADCSKNKECVVPIRPITPSSSHVTYIKKPNSLTFPSLLIIDSHLLVPKYPLTFLNPYKYLCAPNLTYDVLL